MTVNVELYRAIGVVRRVNILKFATGSDSLLYFCLFYLLGVSTYLMLLFLHWIIIRVDRQVRSVEQTLCTIVI